MSDPSDCSQCSFDCSTELSKEDKALLQKIVEEETEELLRDCQCEKVDQVKREGIIQKIHSKFKRKFTKYLNKFDNVVNKMINDYMDLFLCSRTYYVVYPNNQAYVPQQYKWKDNEDMKKEQQEKENNELEKAKKISKSSYDEQEQAKINEKLALIASSGTLIGKCKPCEKCGSLTQEMLDCGQILCNDCQILSNNKVICSKKECQKNDFWDINEKKERDFKIEDDENFKQAIEQSKKTLDDEKQLAEAMAKSIEMERQERIERNLRELEERFENERKVRKTVSEMIRTKHLDFDSLANQLSKLGPNVIHSADTINDKSAMILATVELLSEHTSISDVLEHFADHNSAVRDLCLSRRTTHLYNFEQHNRNYFSNFNVKPVVSNLVNIEIRGDGNCLWSSVSHCLFGDYSMMESLRVLTASALLYYEQPFRDLLNNQAKQYNYRHALTFEELLRSATSLQTWGDELHIMALSLALKRPVFSYGSLADIPDVQSMTYQDFRQAYEYQEIHNHFKYIGDTSDTVREPILIHYDGQTHYSAVLKTKAGVQPMVPYVQMIDPIVNREMSAENDTNNVQDELSSNQIKIYHNGVIQAEFSEESDQDEKNKICENQMKLDLLRLKKELAHKNDLIKSYQNFYKSVKKMFVNETFNEDQIAELIEEIEAKLRN